MHPASLLHTSRWTPAEMTSKWLPPIFKAVLFHYDQLLPHYCISPGKGERKGQSMFLETQRGKPLQRAKTNPVPSPVFITDTSRIGYWALQFITNESLTAPRIQAITQEARNHTRNVSQVTRFTLTPVCLKPATHLTSRKWEVLFAIRVVTYSTLWWKYSFKL